MVVAGAHPVVVVVERVGPDVQVVVFDVVDVADPGVWAATDVVGVDVESVGRVDPVVEVAGGVGGEQVDPVEQVVVIAVGGCGDQVVQVVLFVCLDVAAPVVQVVQVALAVVVVGVGQSAQTVQTVMFGCDLDR